MCTANICRSPMAQAVFNALAEDEGPPSGPKGAGTAAIEGTPIAPNAVAVLKEVGICHASHSARRVREAMIKDADLVLPMTPQIAPLSSGWGAIRREGLCLAGVHDERPRGGDPGPLRAHSLATYRSTCVSSTST